MKKYYCLIVIGNKLDGIEDTLNKVIDGKFMHKKFNDIIFISTFESEFSIWEIEEILHRDKRSYFLTKMDGNNFTATVQDINIQNDLFLDYVNKMTAFNDAKIEENDRPKPIDMDRIEEFIRKQDFLNSIKKDSNHFGSRKKKEKTPVPPTLDELLDKINRVGYKKLTKFEKECLENYSKN